MRIYETVIENNGDVFRLRGTGTDAEEVYERRLRELAPGDRIIDVVELDEVA